jgi:dihydroorotate dehydrogenase (NAD+) catalytic subunit
MVRVFGGFVNAVGLANPGAREASKLVRLIKDSLGGAPVIASAAGSSVEEFLEVSALLEDGGADAVELNLSCPHFRGGGIELGQDPNLVGETVKNVAGSLKVPVIAKLGLSDRLVDSAVKALGGGARALTLINSVKAIKIDVYTKKPVLSNKVGGLSGPAIHPIAVRAVYDVYRETGADIIGVGGVRDWETAVELILAGARAVQVGAMLLEKGELIVAEIIRGIEKYLWVEGIQSVRDLVGLAHKA